MSQDNYTITLERDKFSKLLNLMKLLENSCTDCDISQGVIRQKTNDKQCIVEMDVSSILANNHLSLSVIKSKVTSLKTFELDDNVQMDNKSLTIEANDSNYEFTDSFSKMIFRKPIRKFLDQKFIEDGEASAILRTEEQNLVFSVDINNYLKRRISNTCLAFQTDTICCSLNDLKAKIWIETTNHENSAILINDVNLNRQFQSKMFRITALSFFLDIMSDLKMSAYHVSNDVLLCKFEQAYFGVPVKVYTQAKIVSQ